jgi:nucleotide-binding universal stress UspA family protein
MFDEVIVCLDGSSLAEKILPLARGLAAAKGAKLTLLRVVEDVAELASEEEYLRDCARQYAAELSLLVGADAGAAIVAHLANRTHALAALTTHGRSAWSEAILGSVALRVMREAKRPVLIFCPIDKAGDAPKRIDTIVAAVDGSALSEKIIPHAAEAARALAAGLLLVQVLPAQPVTPPTHEKSDLNEAAYLHAKAAAIKKRYGLDAQWEVLHGDVSEAICQFVDTMPNTLLAMTTHARAGIERAILGSVAAACVRRAAVPLLLYWPPDKSKMTEK